MKTRNTSLILILATLLTVAHTALGETKINIIVTAPSRTDPPPIRVVCEFADVLKYKKAKNPDNLDVPTLVLNKENMNRENGLVAKDGQADYCLSSIKNLTRINEEAVREDLAKILRDIPCKPGKELDLWLNTEDRPMDKLPSGAKSQRVVRDLIIKGCMDDMPDNCNYPSDVNLPNSDRLQVGYDELMLTAKRCRDELISKVEREGLREKWAAERKAKEAQDAKTSESAPVEPTKGKKP